MAHAPSGRRPAGREPSPPRGAFCSRRGSAELRPSPPPQARPARPVKERETRSPCQRRLRGRHLGKTLRAATSRFFPSPPQDSGQSAAGACVRWSGAVNRERARAETQSVAAILWRAGRMVARSRSVLGDLLHGGKRSLGRRWIPRAANPAPSRVFQRWGPG